MSDQTADAAPRTGNSEFRPLRIWPAIVLVVLMPTFRFLPNLVEEGPFLLRLASFMVPFLLGLLLMIWWLTLSRATWLERMVGFASTALIAIATVALSDKSMRVSGTFLLAVPIGTAAFAIGTIVCGRLLSFKRTIVAILLAACGFGFTALLRNDGMWGDYAVDWEWRWKPTDEERTAALRNSQPTKTTPEISASDLDAWLAEAEWPRFRGKAGLGQQHGPRIATDWKTNAPKEIWRIPTGPGWSSFAVTGNLLFTQEQRGEQEVVVCYAADTGAEIWAQDVGPRFDEALGGPGPRATPTLAAGGLFVQGAKGQLQRIEPKTGDVVWMQDLRKVARPVPPDWGFASSPLVVGDVVIVHAGGEDDKGTLAFDLVSGELKWSAAAGDHSYSSPQLSLVGGDELVLMLTNTGIDLLDPATGEARLNYQSPQRGYRVLQPQVVDGDSILISSEQGTQRVQVSKEDGVLSGKETWTSRNLKPDYNDFVVHKGHAYGFDGAIFACIDLATGDRKWKGGRYGKGQVLLLADSDLLLVAGERGEVALLKADPTGHQELAKFSALQGKTWNHPVVINDRLYIRNGQEAACFRLPMAEDAN